MMTCKQAAMLMSTGEVDAAPLRTRLALRLHLSMCRHCRAFKRQMESLAKLGRALSSSQGSEPPRDYEARLAERLTANQHGGEEN